MSESIITAHGNGRQHLKVTAAQFGVSVATVRRALKKAGVTTRRRGLRDEAEWRRRIDLFNRFLLGGLSMAEAASEIGAGRVSISRWAEKLGIELLSVKVCSRAHRRQKILRCRLLNPALSAGAISERFGLKPRIVACDLRQLKEKING